MVFQSQDVRTGLAVMQFLSRVQNKEKPKQLLWFFVYSLSQASLNEGDRNHKVSYFLLL